MIENKVKERIVQRRRLVFFFSQHFQSQPQNTPHGEASGRRQSVIPTLRSHDLEPGPGNPSERKEEKKQPQAII